MTYSLSAIVPANKRDDANAILESLGYGPDNFSVPLIAELDDGTEVVRAYGFHSAVRGMRRYLNGERRVPKVQGMTRNRMDAVIASVRMRRVDARNDATWGSGNFIAHTRTHKFKKRGSA